MCCWHSYRLSCFASSSLGNRSTIRYEPAVSKYESRVRSHCYTLLRTTKPLQNGRVNYEQGPREDARITHARPTITAGGGYIFFLSKCVSLAERYAAKDRFCLRSIIIVGCWILCQKFKDWAPTKVQTTREAISLFWRLVSPCILILLRLFAHNFIFGVEANISALAEIPHVIATKFQPR